MKRSIKHLFRFFRGELNGFLLFSLCTFLNRHTERTGLLDELAYALSFQWILEEEEEDGRIAIRNEDMFNIAKIGGLYHLRLFGQTNYGAIWFTPSTRLIIQGEERSERGLARKSYEDFIFIRTTNDSYPTDINTESSESLRTTLVEHGATILGYVAEGSILFSEDGSVIVEAILPEPPNDRSFIEWYGINYLHFEEEIIGVFPLSAPVFKSLFESVQRIRRLGSSLEAFLEITELLLMQYVHNIEIVWDNGIANVIYSLDETFVLKDRERRYRAWLKLVEMKFNQFNLVLRV